MSESPDARGAGNYAIGGIALVLAVVAFVFEFTAFPMPASMGLLLLVSGFCFLWIGHNENRIRRLERALRERRGQDESGSTGPSAAEPTRASDADRPPG